MGHDKQINSIEDVKPGHHLCCIYGTEEEHKALLTTFLQHGLEHNEKVVYIVDKHTATTILGYLKDEGLDYQRYIEKGQLQVLSVANSYMKEGVFDPDSMISLLRCETERALSEGYAALRVTGEMSWALKGLPGSQRLIEYESKLNTFFPGSKCLAMCQYNRKLFDAELLLKVLSTHPVAVIGTEIFDNFYYIPPGKFFSQDLNNTILRLETENLLKRKRIIEELRIRNRILEIFLTIPDEQMYAEVLNLVLKALKSEFGTFGYFNKDGSFSVPATTREIYWEKCNIPDKEIIFQRGSFSGIWNRAIEEKKTLYSNKGPFNTPKGHVPIKNTMVTPIYYRGKLLSAIHIANKATDYDERDKALLETVAGHIAPVLYARLEREREEKKRKKAEAALREAHKDLEERVEERTAQLSELVDELREAELRYRTVADLTYDWEYWKSPDGTFRYVSPSCERITGYKPEEFMNNPELFRELILPEDKTRWEEHHQEAFKEKGLQEIKFRIHKQDGQVRWIEHVCQPVYGEKGKFLGFRASNRDITKGRQMEEEASRLRSEYLHIARVSAMGELTASLAHELKQPLAAIRSNAQAAQRFMANDKPDLDELSEILVDIIKDNRRADGVIGRLRTLMRKSELQIAELNINNVIQDIFPLIRSYEIMRNISLEFELDDKIPSVAGDRVQLQQVMLNLIMNSSEALINIDRYIRRIVIRTSQKNHQNVTVAIRDNGTGIDEKSLDSLFEPFYTTKQEGMGMGLPISRSIIEAHGGNLWAENNPDRGATFYFTIPVFQSSLA